MKFVTYNVQYGLGKDEKFDLPRIASAVHGADVVALQEVSRFMPMAPPEDQAAEIARHLPDYHWVYGPAVDVDGSAGAKNPSQRRIQFGNMLLSRTPILTSTVYPLPKQTLVDYPSYQRVALEGTIASRDGPVRVYSIHLSPNNPGERMRQIDALFRILAEGAAGHRVWTGPGGWFLNRGGVELQPARDAVVMGDFNLEPGSAEYTRLTGEKDAIYGRIATTTGLVDTWVRCGNLEHKGATCPRYPKNDTHYDMRIDYGFVTSGLVDRCRGAWIDSDAKGSDHQPVWFELDL